MWGREEVEFGGEGDGIIDVFSVYALNFIRQFGDIDWWLP